MSEVTLTDIRKDQKRAEHLHSHAYKVFDILKEAVKNESYMMAGVIFQFQTLLAIYKNPKHERFKEHMCEAYKEEEPEIDFINYLSIMEEMCNFMIESASK